MGRDHHRRRLVTVADAHREHTLGATPRPPASGARTATCMTPPRLILKDGVMLPEGIDGDHLSLVADQATPAVTELVFVRDRRACCGRMTPAPDFSTSARSRRRSPPCSS